MTDTRRILALDPATRTGWAWGDGSHPIYGVWNLGVEGRFAVLRHGIEDIARHRGIDLLAYEDAGFAAKGQQRVAAFHSELRGAIKAVGAELNVPTLAINPTSLKKFATQNGHAKKVQMIAACKTILGIETRDDNEADALWVLAYARAYRPEWAPEKKRKKKSKRKEPQSRLFR